MSSMTEQIRRDGVILFAGTAVDVLVPAAATAGAFSLLRIAHPPGCWTPPHLHQNEDETVFVLTGTLKVETERHTTDVGPGQAIVLPRGRPHRLGNAGVEETRILVLCTPGGFDEFVRAAGRPMPDGGPTMAEADVPRLVQAAPRHGIELLTPDALRLASSASPAAEPVAEEINVLGVPVQVLAEFGPDDDDLCLIHGRVPPGGFVPLHGHDDHELLYGLSGVLETWIGPADEADWRPVGAGDVADIPGGLPHALRNRGDVPADTLLVTTRRIAGLFLEIGHQADAALLGPPSFDRMHALAVASHSCGYWLANEAENAALDLQPG